MRCGDCSRQWSRWLRPSLLFLAAAAQAQLPGDVNCDGVVNGGDVTAVVAAIFADAEGDCSAADVNSDGRIDGTDIVALMPLLAPPPTPVPVGPQVTFLGLAAADGVPAKPLGSINGVPVYFRGAGSGFQIVVEGRAGLSGQPAGLTIFDRNLMDPSHRPDLQIESDRPLGDGSAAVCDGGVPAVDPPDFGPTQLVANALNDLACNAVVATARTVACTLDTFARPNFLGSNSQAQFCIQVLSSFEFPAGETLLTVRLRDTAGNLGPLQQLIVRVGTGPVPPTFTLNPTPSPTRSPIATPTVTQRPLTTTATPTTTGTRTRIPTAPTSPSSTAFATRTATGGTPPTSSPTPSRTATTFGPSPTPSSTPTGTAASPPATRTASHTPTPPPTATRIAIPSRTASASPTPSRTPGGLIGPVITFFGITRADDTLVNPIDTTLQGVPIYTRVTGTGFSLVVEGKPGSSRQPVGLSAYDPDVASLPDLQIEVSRPLGNGSSAVCDRLAPMAGGVPATDPPSFDPTQTNINTVNDLACRFLDGSGNPVGRAGDACVLFASGDFHFVNATTTVEFCGFVDTPLEFPVGDTLVTVRLLDSAGNPGPPAQILVQVER